MIECPICHVNNDDQAHFCTECGHRFPASSITSTPPPQPYQPRPQSSMTGMPNITPVVSQSASSLNSPKPTAPTPPGQPSLNSSPGSTPSSNSTANPDSIPFPVTPVTPVSSFTPSTSSSTYMDNNNPNFPNQGHQEPPKRPKFHSPLLGGDDPDDEAYAQDNYEAAPPKAPKTKSGLLRSPLLGGGGGGRGNDFDDDEPAANSRPPKGSKPVKGAHLRSPLLGGSADDEDDYEEDFPLRDKQSSGGSAFPHRRGVTVSDAPEPAPGSNTGSRPHLRSPLLRGDDEYEDGDNYNAGHSNQAPAPVPQGRPQKLSSPLFGKQNGVYEYADDEDDQLSVNDNPNALRSPLLAARSPMAAPRPAAPTPAPTTPTPMVQPPAPVQAAAQAQPAPLSQPASLPQFPNPRPMTTQPPALGSPLPMTPAITPDMHEDDSAQDSFAWRDRGFANAAPSAASPSSTANPMPAYTPGMPQPAAPLPEPTGFPAPSAPLPAPSLKESPKPAHVPAPPAVQKVEPKLKSKLLSGSSNANDSFDDDYDDDYKAPSAAGGRKRFGDDSHQSNSYQPGRSGSNDSGSSGPIMVLVVPIALVTLGKAYFLFALVQGNQLFASPATAVDQLGQFVMLLALLIYGLMGNKR